MDDQMNLDEFNQFLEDRNAALLSLDRAKIEGFAKKYGVDLSKNELVFWASIHKARCNWTGCPEIEKMASRHWLKKHGFKEGFPEGR